MADKIHGKMTFGELVRDFPSSAPILAEYGMHCIGCHIGISETIEEGARAHGLSSDDITKLITQLNARAV